MCTHTHTYTQTGILKSLQRINFKKPGAYWPLSAKGCHIPGLTSVYVTGFAKRGLIRAIINI